MEATEELGCKIALSVIPKIGINAIRNLIAYTGSPEAVFKESKKALKKIPGIGDILADNILKTNSREVVEAELGFINKFDIKPLFFTDEEYPQRLRQCYDAPIILYYKGNADLNQKKVISIVGTRNMTQYGKEICVNLIKGLKPYNPLIVSGLAYGVDITAHRNAIQNELYTVGVLAHGLDNVYPSVHKNTAKQMLSHGGLLTEFRHQTDINRKYFLQRNRIIAGLSDATIIVESAKKGGSLVTADIANSYDREVFSYPGKISDKLSEGCNNLIRKLKAHLIMSADDLIENMNWDIEQHKNKKDRQKQLFFQTTPEEEKILKQLESEGEMYIDLICLQTKLDYNTVLSSLLNLEFEDKIIQKPGKVYALK